MKKISVTRAIALSVGLIVLSLILPVNYSIPRVTHGHAVFAADGAGLPPTPPPLARHVRSDHRSCLMAGRVRLFPC